MESLLTEIRDTSLCSLSTSSSLLFPSSSLLFLSSFNPPLSSLHFTFSASSTDSWSHKSAPVIISNTGIYFRQTLPLYIHSTPPPPIPPLTGLVPKRLYWKTTVKGLIDNQEKTSSGLENQRRYWGGGGQRRGGVGGDDDCIQGEVFPSQIDKIKLGSCTFLSHGLILLLYSVQTDVLLLC